jgi:hypothetical protein
MLVVLMHRYSPSAPTPTTRINRHMRSPSLCCKYMFQVFQSFQRYVAVVLYGYCKSRSGTLYMLQVFRDMLQEFIQNISSVPDVCCKCFDQDVAYVSHICCSSMFQMFYLFQSSIAASVFMLQVANILSGCCICFHTYITSVF